MLSTRFLVVVIICISIFNGAYGHGVLHVDNVYSSANKQIKIDNLVSTAAITTTTETHGVEFKVHSSLAMAAPKLSLAGSYLSVITQNDVKYVSQNDTITLAAGHNFDTNSRTLSFLGNTLAVQSVGEINFLSRNQTDIIGRNIDYLAGEGGIDISSTSGPILVTTNSSLSFSSATGLSIEAERDITFRTEKSIIADVSDGFVYLIADRQVQLASSNDVTFTSTEFVGVEAEQFYLTAGNFTSVGTNARFTSGADDLYFSGFERILFDANEIEINGVGGGTRWISQYGYASLTSLNGDISFIANSASDDSRTVIETDYISVLTNDDFSVNALTGIKLTSDFELELDLDRTFTATSRRDTFVRSASEINYNAATNFATTADTLIFNTMDEATANESHGLIQMSALLPTFDVETFFAIYAASLDISGKNSVAVTATNDLTILADYSDGTSQQLAINAGVFNIGTGRLDIEGGAVTLSGSVATFRTTTDLTINANKEKTSYLDFESKSNRWTVQSFDHDAGESIIQSDATTLTVGGKTTFKTSRFHDISLTLDTFSATAAKDINSQVVGDLSILVEGAGSFASTADNRISSNDFFSSNYRFAIYSPALTVSTNDLIITTDRNEATNDHLYIDIDQSGDFTINNFVYVSGERTEILSNGQTYNAVDILLASDDSEPISFDVGSSLIDASNDLTINGNNIAFEAAGQMDFEATSFVIEGESNGVYMESLGFISLSVAGDFNVYTVDEFRVSSTGNYNTLADSVLVSVDEKSYIHSDQEDITITSSTIAFFNADNVTIASGNSAEDQISIDVTGSLTFFATGQKYFSLSTPDGTSSVVASGNAGTTTSIISNTFTQESGGITSFNAQTTYSFAANSISSKGGDISVTAVDTDISIHSGDSTTIEFKNLASSLASEEFYDYTDRLSFSSGSGSVIFTDDATAGTAASFVAGGSILIASESTSNAGTINFISQQSDVTFSSLHPDYTSDHENYDVSFSSGGNFVINTVNDATIDANGDFMIHADQAITFTQKDFYASIWDDFNIISEKGSISIDHTGSSIQIFTNNEDIPSLERENSIEFNSVQRLSVYANDGIAFLTNGFGTVRRDVAGNSNIEKEFDQSVGFSLRTYDPLGDFVVQSRNDFINIDVFGTTLFLTEAEALIETHREQYWQASDIFTMEATDGSVFIYGADGIDVTVGVNTFFLSSRYTDFVSDNLLDVSSALNFYITSHHADISFYNYQTTDIKFTANNGYTKFTGGSEINVLAQGDISFDAADAFSAIADRGYYLTTTGQGITWTGTGFGSTVSSSEEINILSGGDLYLINEGDTLQDMKFTGDGVVFQTTAGDITFTADNNVEITSEIILINAFGTSSTGRDTAQFNSIEGDTTFSTVGEIRINANNLVDLGEDLSPPTIIFSAADVTFNSQGNYEMKSAEGLIVSTPDGRNALSSIASTTFTTGTDFTAQAEVGDINVHALHGSIGITAQDALNENVESVVITSEGVTSFTTGLIEVFSTNFGSSASYLQQITVGTDFTVNGATDATITTSFNPTDEIVISARNGQMDASTDFKLSAINTIDLFLSAATFDISGGDTSFIGNDDNTDIVIGSSTTMNFEAAGNLDFSSKSIKVDVNLRPNVARGDVSFITEEIISSAYSYLFETNKEYKVTAPVASSTVEEFYRVLAVNDVKITSTTLFNVATENTKISTRPYVASDDDLPLRYPLNWEATDFTLDAEAIATFSSKFTDIFATGDNTWSSSKFTVNNYGFSGNIIFSSVEDYLMNPTTSIQASAGGDSDEGYLTISGNLIGINSDVLSIISQQDETQPAANVIITANTGIITDGDILSVTATSNLEEHQGTIYIGSGDSVHTYQSNTLSFSAKNAGFNLQATNFITTASLSMETLTNGLNAGIDLKGKTLAPISTLTFLSTAGLDHEVIATNGNLDLVATTSFSVLSDGKASNDDAGIQIRTDNDAGAITVTTTTSTYETNGAFNVHATDSILSSSAAATTINSKYASFKSVGLANNLGVNTIGDQPVGQQITANTFDFDTGTDDIIFTSTGTTTTTYTDANTATTFDATSIYYTAHGTVQLNALTVSHDTTAQDVAFIAHSRGITFAGEATPFSATASDSLTMNTGLLQESASFRVTGNSNILFTATAGDTTFSADNNALFNSEGVTTIQATNAVTGVVSIDATKGDILFRSIDSPTDVPLHSLTFQGENIYMSAYYRIEHRQHQEIGFFNPANQNGRTTSSAARQTTTFFGGLQPLGPNVNGCFCTMNDGSDSCANVGCPSITARVIQMQAALETMGLLAYSPRQANIP